jgi:hypothetical protein
VNDLFDEAMAILQSPSEAQKLARLVIEHLETVEDFDLLPNDIARLIREKAAQLYGAGFVKGFRAAHEIVRRFHEEGEE